MSFNRLFTPSRFASMALALLLGVLSPNSQAQTGPVVQGKFFSATACATERWPLSKPVTGANVCRFEGTRSVAYGAQGQFVVRTATEQTDCSNDAFGSTLSVSDKKCYLDVQTLGNASVTAAAPAVNSALACFYQHINYQGNSFCVTPGEAASMPSGWNDQVSSVKLNAGVSIELFEDPNFQGRQISLTASDPNFVKLSFNDKLSAYQVVAPSNGSKATSAPTAVRAQACFFEHINFSGDSFCVNASQAAAMPSSWWNNRVSSVQLQGGLSVVLFEEPNFQGPSITLNATNPSLVKSAFNDKLSSYKVFVPSSGGTTTGTTPPAVGMTQAEAARLLIQATYGPTMAEIDRTAAMGASAWVNEQFTIPAMDSHWNYVMVRKGPLGCTVCNSDNLNAVMESFWTQAVRGPDQLRQRTVLALSEIFVVSALDSAIAKKDPHAGYLDVLSRNAFGNFRNLLEDVATHPTMGVYLSHMRNVKEDAATGRLPDENFARELMQLFSIGLWELNADGTRKKDALGQDIPTYSNRDVMGLAKVFTGWSWNGPDTSNMRWFGMYEIDWKGQMQNYPQFHSSSEKSFLGTTIAANTSGPQSLKLALDTIFNHPNVGPFIGRQLIQRFVTSNPSPAYVARVTAAFNNNGAGVRGDMKAVLRAVLLDTEARSATSLSQAGWGKLREPVVRFGNWLRAFDTSAASGLYAIWNLEDAAKSLGQNPLRAPSVFNWYRPDYAPTGPILNRGLAAPEFQITDETTVTSYANFVTHVVANGYNWNENNIKSSYTPELALASNPAALIDRLDLLLTADRMSTATRQIILDAVNAVPVSKPAVRVHTAVALTLLSPEFIVQK